jgi:hypothetical protein
VTDAARGSHPNDPKPGAPPDEEYANGFAEGYGEGLREAFREVLQHASRGHTAQELRLLVESRLARIPEDVEVRRKSLLAPPRRPAWGPLLRTPTSPPAAEAGGVSVGKSTLFFEPRPARGPASVAQNHRAFRKVVSIGTFPPEFSGVPAEKLLFLRLGPAEPAGASTSETLTPGQVLGEVRSLVEAGLPVLVYLDAVEFLMTEESAETTLKFVNWLTGEVSGTPSALVASVDPGALSATDRSRLQRSFNILG